MIKAVVFDFDHTLYDRAATDVNMADDFIEFFADILKDGLSREEVLQAILKGDFSGTPRREKLYKDPNYKPVPEDHFRGIHMATVETGIFKDPPDYQRYYFGFIENYFPKAVQLYPDTLSVLKTLRERGYKLGILTNGPSNYQRNKLNCTDLHSYVDEIVLCGDLEHQKPHPSSFEAVCKRLGVSFEETVFVGDSPVNDVDGARKVGMIPLWMNSIGKWNDSIEPAKYSIDKLSEILGIIDEIKSDI